MAEGRQFDVVLRHQIDVLRDNGLSDDEAIARLAAHQHGRVARAQLLAIGVTPGAIRSRRATGRLREVHAGVYAVGHEAPSRHAKWTSAVLAVDGHLGMRRRPRAALSHSSGRSLWAGTRPRPGVVHVSSPAPRGSQPGIAIHRAQLPCDELAVHDGIVVTSPARTLLDLAAVHDDRRLERIVRDFEFKRLVAFVELEAILERYPRRRGRGQLHEIVARAGREQGRTRSQVEDDFRRFIRGLPLPEPVTNVEVATAERRYPVDVYWPEARLVVELDSVAAHQTAFSFEEDRRRDRALAAVGIHTLRVTEHALASEQAAVRREVIASWKSRRTSI